MTALLGRIPIEKIRNGYLMVLLICLCVRNIGAYSFLPPVIDVSVFSGLAAFGFFLFAVEMMKGEIDFRLSDNIFLFLFIGALILSSIINFRYGIFQNVKECIWTIISFFVIGSCAGYGNMRNMRKIVMKIQNVVIVFWLVLSVLSLCTAVFQIGHSVILENNTWIGIGIVENRLFGLFINPNSASIVSVIAILFSIFQIAYNPNGALRTGLNIANIVVQLLYISLSESRGSVMVLLFLGFALVFLYGIKTFAIGGQKKFWLSFLVACMFTVILYSAMNLIMQIFSALPSFSSDIEVLSRRYGCHAKLGKRSDYVENNDISNLRFRIWFSAWDIFKENWIFGVTPGNILSYAKEVMPRTFMAERNYKRAHSVWFGIPLYTGICGTFFMFGFFIKKAWGFFVNYKKIGFKREVPLFNLCVIIIMCIWVYGLVESEILFVNSVCSFVFWFFMGISAKCINSGRKGIES